MPIPVARVVLLRAVVGQTYPLDGAAEAHRVAEARETVGKALLMVR